MSEFSGSWELRPRPLHIEITNLPLELSWIKMSPYSSTIFFKILSLFDSEAQPPDSCNDQRIILWSVNSDGPLDCSWLLSCQDHLAPGKSATDLYLSEKQQIYRYTMMMMQRNFLLLVLIELILFQIFLSWSLLAYEGGPLSQGLVSLMNLMMVETKCLLNISLAVM